MNNRFEELFGTFHDEKLHEVFQDAQIENVRISMEKKSIEIDAFFPVIATYKILFKAEEILRENLSVSSVTVFPRMPAEIFSEAYFGTLVDEANLAIAATNGFFADSSAVFDGKMLRVELFHGGGDILKGVGAAEFMERLILKRFGRSASK